MGHERGGLVRTLGQDGQLGTHKPLGGARVYNLGLSDVRAAQLVFTSPNEVSLLLSTTV